LFAIGPDAQRGLIGIRLDATAGPYALKLQRFAKQPGRWQTILEESVAISSKTFPTENVNFAPEKSALFRWEHKESARIHKLLMSGSPEQFWEGAIRFSRTRAVIGEFGVHRVRNGIIDAGITRGTI